MTNFQFTQAHIDRLAFEEDDLLRALVALWHKLKDEQEKQKPSEPEKVTVDQQIAKLQSDVAKLAETLRTLIVILDVWASDDSAGVLDRFKQNIKQLRKES